MYIFFILLLIAPNVLAEELPITGTYQQQIPVTHANKLYPNGFKDIKLLEYELPSEIQEIFYQQVTRRLEQSDPQTQNLNNDLPNQVQLGMANVPVLDQGIHGSCAVFAVTAALDAALKRGDHVSQLCLLQLGNYLEAEDQDKSGWNGTNLEVVTKRIEQYGVMNITNQHLYGCAGSRLYPAYFFTPTNGMSPEEYAQHRMLPIGHQVNWHFIYRAKRFGKADPAMLQKMKTALHAGSRLVVSALLPRVDLGNSGATGTYHYTDDTWVLTDEIAQDLLFSKKIAGHAMVITGYDDLAVVKDHVGHRHQGLFTLRNSWSAWVGDWGNFYMSYDYAELLLLKSLRVDKEMQ